MSVVGFAGLTWRTSVQPKCARTTILPFGAVALTTALLATLICAPADARGRAKQIAKPIAPIAKSVAPAASAAQTLPLLEPFPETAVAKSELVVGDLRATVTSADTGKVLPVSSSASVTISINAGGGNHSAAVLVESEGGEILTLSGAGAKSSPIRGGLSAEVALPASGVATLNVEMGLKGGARGADGKLRNRLRVTLLPQKGGKDESVLAWGLADCAGEYYGELQKIITTRRDHMTPMLEAAFAPATELPNRWIFSAKSTSPLLICKGARGKKVAACAGAAFAKPTADKQADKAQWDEPRVLQLASEILASKGTLPGFQKRTQPLRQASYTLLNGLRVYMEQEAHPALCSGVDAMVGYYQDHTPFLRHALASGKDALPAAQQLATAKVAELTGAPAAPGYSGADLADRVAKVVLTATDASETANIKDLAPKLEHMRALLDGASSATDPATDKRDAAISALRLIEANLYLAVAAKKYADLDDAIYGTMSAITDAHKAKCVCQ